MKYIISLFLYTLISFSVFAETIINVYPIKEKQSSGIYITKGKKLNFKVNGKWSLWDEYKPVGPEGHSFTANEYGNWGTLLAKIGDGDIFVISNGLKITSVNEGVLYLFPNKGKYKMKNQSGALEVSIDGGISINEFTDSLSGKSTKIVYDSKNIYKQTNLYIKKGEKIQIYAFGKFSMWDGIFPDVNAEGHEFLSNGVQWGKLYGGIGSTDSQYLEYFPIGEKTIYTAKNPGLLTIFAYTGEYATSEKGSLNVYIIGGKTADKNRKIESNELIRKTSEKLLLSKINEIRASVSLPKLSINTKLSKSAYSHAIYMTANKTFSRKQEKDKPYFLGKTLKDRLKTLGFTEKSREMFVQTNSEFEPNSVLKVLEILFNTVYHRLRLLNPAIKYFGYGSYRSNKNTIYVLDFGYDKEKNVSNWESILYPQSESINIDHYWSGIENPDPFPVGTIKPLGPPITLMINKKINKVTRSEIIDESGKKVNSFIITPFTDLNSKEFNAVILVPKSPLQPNTRYTVMIKTNIGINKEEKEFNWSFVTKDK